MKQICHSAVTLKVCLYLLHAWLLLACNGLAVAEDHDEQVQLDQLLNLLSEQTTLATKTRINADFVPGMVSIMKGSDMQQRGFVSLWDAMAYMPGVIRSIDSTGMRSLNVRGVSQSVGSGKIRLMLNNQVVNASSTATTGPLLDTPVNQIERVEFIRGPGSAIHGEFAIAGVINVITQNTGQGISASAGSSGAVGLHALLSHQSDHSGINASLNISTVSDEGEDITASSDRTPSNNDGYAPGLINNKREVLSAIGQLNWNDLSLVFQYQQSNRGDHYGRFNYLPPEQRQTVISENLYNLKLSQSLTLSDQLSIDWSLSQLRNSIEKNQQFLGIAAIYGGLPSDDDVFSDVDLEEHRNEGQLGFHYRTDNHHWYVELSHTQTEIDHYRQFINLDPTSGQYSTTLNPFPPPIDPSTDRTTSSLVLQDEVEITANHTLTAGLRYDRYDDIGDNLSPRLAFVWRASDRDILKVQYSEAFRPPNLLEYEGAVDGSIKPETINSIEASFIHVKQNFSIRNTLYHSTIENLIAFHDTAPFGYDNFNQATVKGLEIEMEQTFGQRLTGTLNLSMQDISKPQSTLLLSDIPAWFIATGISYRLNPDQLIHGQLKHIPESDRNPGDDRPDLDSSTQLDITYTHQNLLEYTGFNLSISVKNLLGDTIKSAAPAGTYQNDYIISEDPRLWVELKLLNF